MSGRILVGTSSWADPGFIKDWYPPKHAGRAIACPGTRSGSRRWS